MTQVVKVDFKEPKSVGPLVALDDLSTEAQSVVDARGSMRKFIDAEPLTLGGADKCLAELQALKPSEKHLIELALQIESGLLRATPEQIQEQLTLLLGAFPSSNTPDPMVYSRMMLHEVAAAQASVIALTMACTELRRTLQWPPSVPQVLKKIQEQEACWRYRLRCVTGLANDYAETLSKLLKTRAWLARPTAEKEAERQARLARMESLERLLRAKTPLRKGARKWARRYPRRSRNLGPSRSRIATGRAAAVRATQTRRPISRNDCERDAA